MSGIVGIVSETDCVKDIFYATDFHSHLGTQYGGMAVSDGRIISRIVHNISKAQFKSRFFDDTDFQGLHGNMAIGVISDRDYQPSISRLRFGEYSIVGAGFIANQEELARELINNGESIFEVRDNNVNQMEIAASLINKGKDLVDGINHFYNKIRGSMSLLLLGREGIYAARTKYGHTPLILGEKEGSKIVAFETTSFKNLGYHTKRGLGPGEIVFLDENKEEQLQKPGNILQLCAFLFVYTGFPTSEYEGKNVSAFRFRSGETMAERDDVDLDLISGVADSGTIYAKGYAFQSGLPNIAITSKYTPGWQRSYTPPDQRDRDFIALMKQVVSEELIRGKKVGITEDSIVRGTQLRSFYLTKLFRAGAKEAHVRPACPPLMFPCQPLLSTRKYDELFARRIIQEINGGSIQDICPYLDPDSSEFKEMIRMMERDMGATSLRYQTLDDMVEATKIPKKDLCTYCWTGEGSF